MCTVENKTIGSRSSGPPKSPKAADAQKVPMHNKKGNVKPRNRTHNHFNHRLTGSSTSSTASHDSAFPFTSRAKAIVLHLKSLNPTSAPERPEDFNPPIKPEIAPSTQPLLLTRMQNQSHIVYNLPISDDRDTAIVLSIKIDPARSQNDWNALLFGAAVGVLGVDVWSGCQLAETWFAGCKGYGEDAVVEAFNPPVLVEDEVCARGSS